MPKPSLKIRFASGQKSLLKYFLYLTYTAIAIIPGAIIAAAIAPIMRQPSANRKNKPIPSIIACLELSIVAYDTNFFIPRSMPRAVWKITVPKIIKDANCIYFVNPVSL